jgi:hypothetical protein
MKTTVEWLQAKLWENNMLTSEDLKLFEQAKEMEKQDKIEFACQVAEASAMKYIQGKTTMQIAQELIKQQEQ